jgi:hypothetical protein
MADNRFEGSARVKLKSSVVSIPITVLSDGSTVVVNADTEKVNQLGTAVQARELRDITNKYSDVVTEPHYQAYLPALLRQNFASFEERLETVVPVEKRNGYYFGTGCKAHECGSNEAAWAIAEDGESAAAVVLATEENEIMDPHKVFYVYGASPEALPPPLAHWAAEQGMTTMNSVRKMPEPG